MHRSATKKILDIPEETAMLPSLDEDNHLYDVRQTTGTPDFDLEVGETVFLFRDYDHNTRRRPLEPHVELTLYVITDIDQNRHLTLQDIDDPASVKRNVNPGRIRKMNW
eukprot:Polyplicarium_translucidae@DN3202_c1_g1_i1.p1